MFSIRVTVCFVCLLKLFECNSLIQLIGYAYIGIKISIRRERMLWLVYVLASCNLEDSFSL